MYTGAGAANSPLGDGPESRSNNPPGGTRCRMCQPEQLFITRSALRRHQLREHNLMGGAELQDMPWGPNDSPFDNMPNGDAIEEEYMTHRAYILAPHYTPNNSLNHYFNFPINTTIEPEQIQEHMRYIFEHERHSFRLNLSAGLILIERGENDANNEGELRYFRARNNMELLNRSLLVHDQHSLGRAITKLQEMDLNDMIHNFRPGSNWVPLMITNVMYNVYPLSRYNLAGFHDDECAVAGGGGTMGNQGEEYEDTALPLHIRRNRHIVTEACHGLKKNMCVFIALAQHFKLAERKQLRKECREKGIPVPRDNRFKFIFKRSTALYRQWLAYCRANRLTKYYQGDSGTGVDLCDMVHLEVCFSVRINVHHLNSDGSSYTFYTSDADFPAVIHMNIYKKHVNFIIDIKRYSTKYLCDICERIFYRQWNMVRHRRGCTSKSKHIHPGGFYRQHRTLFQELEHFNINVPEELRYYDHVVCWDMESILKPIEYESDSGKFKEISQHVPVSCSIASNVPGMTEPHTIISNDPTKLVSEMFDHFYKLRKAILEKTEEALGKYYRELVNKVTERVKHNLKLYNDKPIMKPGTDTIMPFRSFLNCDHFFNQLYRLALKFRKYKEQITLLGFNSSGYDHCLIRSELLTHLCEIDESVNINQEEAPEDGEGEMEMEWEGDDDLCDDNPFGPECPDTQEADIMPHERHILQSEILPMEIDHVDGDCEGSDMEEEEDEGEGWVDGGEHIPAVPIPPTPEEICNEILDTITSPQPSGDVSIIKRANRYISISTNHFAFLDLMIYLAPNTSYSKFLTSFNVKERKFWFPYTFMSSYESLEEPLPAYVKGERGPWYNDLRSCDILNEDYEKWVRSGRRGEAPATGEENYATIQAVWEEKEWVKMRDMLKYYNELDVTPMVTGTVRLLSTFRGLKLDTLKNAISLAGLSRILMYRYAEEEECVFPLFSKRDRDLASCVRSQIAAGPSIIFTRYQEKGVTKVSEESDEICQSIHGLDCNSLYAWALSLQMPSYSYLRRHVEDGFIPHYDRQYTMMYIWLRHESRRRGMHIHTRMNSGFEVSIAGYMCDGIAMDPISKKSIVFEFEGCHWHSHVCQKDKKGYDPARATKTKQKVADLEELGYQVVQKYECEFLRDVRSDAEMYDKMNMFTPEFYRLNKWKVTESEIIEAIKNDQVFGFCLCSIRCPSEAVRRRLERFPPLFINHGVKLEDVGSVTQAYIEEKEIKFDTPRRLLIGGIEADDVYMSTNLLRYYMNDLGLVVCNIKELTEYGRACPFKKYVDMGIDMRRRYSDDPNTKMLADTWKTLLNSSFGSLLLNKNTHTRVRIVKGEVKYRAALNDPSFKGMVKLNADYYQIEMAPKKIRHDLSTISGFMILQYAKQRLNEFVYNYLEKYLEPHSFSAVLTDTDSFYFSLSTDSIEEAVMATKKAEYMEEMYGHCGETDYEGLACRVCCPSCAKFDNKRMGAFKQEFKGTIIVALASKTYVAYDTNTDAIKLSLKGINKAKFLNECDNPIQTFLDILKTKTSKQSTNVGFRMRSNRMISYSQLKFAASWLYVKRQLRPGGNYTTVLPIVLNPCPMHYICLSTHCPPLDLDHSELEFTYRNTVFSTMRQAYVYVNAVEVEKIALISRLVMEETDKRVLNDLQRKISTSVVWEEMKAAVLEEIIRERFRIYNDVLLAYLLSYPIHYPIFMNCVTCRVLCTGIDAREFRWVSSTYNSWGGNAVGRIYEKIRSEYQ